MLGKKGRDRITGFSGTITGYCEYLSGCNQLLLVPPVNADGAYREGQWFDVQRVELDETVAPIVLENAAAPGFDVEPPKR